jgi:hypothetical protein
MTVYQGQKVQLSKLVAQKAYQTGNWLVLWQLSKGHQNPWWFVDELILGDDEIG